jgi:alcohol dehydrogenase
MMLGLKQQRNSARPATVNGNRQNAVEAVMALTGEGADAVIEAVGVPATFVLCENIVAPGGTIANIGVHGEKADLHLRETLEP